MSHPINPFLLTGYVSPEYFCDREAESEALASALENGRNVTLVSPRRMGKTGLIRHVFHRIMARGDVQCYYVDLYQTDSLESLVRKLGAVVLGTLDTAEEKIIRRIGTFFRSLRPVVSFDAMTGEPSVSVEVSAGQAERSLVEIFDYMQQSGKRCYIAFDEFQAVAEYADKHVEALLRAHIQHLTSVQFVFSGSQRHVLESMFVSASRPFYQSSQMMYLDRIAQRPYYDFACEKFQQHGQELSFEAFSALYDHLAGHTWYVQMVLNRLYASGERYLTEALAVEMLDKVVAENEATYHTFLNLITPAQGRLMKAVAAEGRATEILGKTFIQAHALGAPSTVKSAAKALVEREMLLYAGEAYEVYDRFFGWWMKKNV